MNIPDLGPKKPSSNKARVSVVSETDDGVFVWVTADGKIVSDSDGNLLNIAAKRNDRNAVDAIKKAAAHYGVAEGGHAQFLEGHRRVSDSEFEHQKAREAAGLIPDPYDIPALRDEMRYLQTRRKTGR